jgi:CheY-like chemotaxis protein
MRKRVLVAEASDTNRRIAETVLRQNGFEVVSVPSAEKAREVLQFARPDLIIIGGDLKIADGAPFYERLADNAKTASIPLLLFEPSEPVDLPFPPEVIIPSPFDPQEFVQRVIAFTGQGAAASMPPNPLSQMTADDELIDAALGLDRIDVTDSEILDRTALPGQGIRIASNAERLVGFDHVEPEAEELSDSKRVESVMMLDENAAKHPPSPPPPPPVSLKLCRINTVWQTPMRSSLNTMSRATIMIGS